MTRNTGFFFKGWRSVGVLSALLLVAGALRCTGVTLDSLEPGGTDDDTADMSTQLPPRTVGLRIVPDNDVLLVDLNKEMQKTFKVVLIQSTGVQEDVTARATITLDNPAIGSLNGSLFTSAKQTANKVDFTRVKATFEDKTALANLTVVWLRLSGPAQDFFFDLPYQSPQQSQPLTFQTFIQSIDTFFAVDTTGSMGPEINNLRSSLSNTIIPAVKKAAVKDAWFGVAAVEDFPVSPYGDANAFPGNLDDQPLILLSPMTASVMTAQQSVDKLMNGGRPRGSGGDGPEGQMEALYQIATGEGNVQAGVVNIPKHQTPGTIGGVEFRTGAFPIVTMVTDIVFHAKGEGGNCSGQSIDYGGTVATRAHTRAQTLAALNKICAKVVGVAAEIPGLPADCSPTKDLTSFAKGTGAMVPPESWGAAGARPAGCNVGQCCTGQGGAGEVPDGSGLCPLVFKIPNNGTGLGTQIVSGISNVALYASFDVVTEKNGTTMGEGGVPVATGKTTADFIAKITPLDATASPPPTSKTPTKTMTGFSGVVPGAVVRFTIEAKNDFQQPLDKPQIFHATIRILAGGCTDLDQRDVIILIPPSAPPVVG
jgi:hypothetical protein